MTNPEAAAVFLHQLAHCFSVMVSVNPSADGLILPSSIDRTSQSLVLEYGLNLPIPINDLEVTEHGICATLSFNRTPFRSYVPWSAVYAFRPREMPEVVKVSPPAAARPGLRAIGPEEIYSASDEDIEAALHMDTPMLRIVN